MNPTRRLALLLACFVLALLGSRCKEPIDPPIPPDIMPCFNVVEDTFRDPRKPVVFQNCSQNATSYLWDFGDGHYSMEAEPAHIFDGVGYFDVRLTASNKDYEQDTVVRIRVDYPRFKKIRIVQVPVLNPKDGMPWDDDGSGLDLKISLLYDVWMLGYMSPWGTNVPLPYEFDILDDVSINQPYWEFLLRGRELSPDTIVNFSRGLGALVDSPVETGSFFQDSVVVEIVMEGAK